MLGLSNASDMFDITGTMWLVALCVVYGLKSIWIPWVWPVFNQIFLMVYLSTWLRRSNVLTGAEWIETRFGQRHRRRSSRSSSSSAFAVLSVLGFLAYGFVGIGKFIEIFLPWSTVAPYVPFDVAPEHVANLYGIAFTTLTMIYAVLGGMFSIVWTDVLKFTLMTIVSVIVAVIAIQHVDPATLAALTPAGWHTPFFGWTLDLDWSGGARRAQPQDHERRLHAVRRVHDDDAVQGRPGQRRRPRAQLRHAEDPLHALAARGGDDERLRVRRAACRSATC